MEKEKTLPQKRRVTRKKLVASEHETHATSPLGEKMRLKMIEDAAYYRYMRRGSGNGGDHVEDWLQAEAEIEALLSEGRNAS